MVGLWPKTPLKKAGIRMLPPMSEPTPITEQAAARTPPSPPAQEKIKQKPWFIVQNKQKHPAVGTSLCVHAGWEPLLQCLGKQAKGIFA